MAPREGATPALPHAAARHQVFFRHLIFTTSCDGEQWDSGTGTFPEGL